MDSSEYKEFRMATNPRPDIPKDAPALMAFEEFLKRTGLKRTSTYLAAREDRLPVRVFRIGPSDKRQRLYFVRAEVEAWLAGAQAGDEC
jgi:predicted DNA-binding transcriptional regulator AlpA